MKTLYLVRHAKSSWDIYSEDHERPLSKRGEKDKALMSGHIASIFAAPDIIISSSAIRALETARSFQAAFQLPEERFFVERSLYDFSGENALKAIWSCEEIAQRPVETLMVFGHNHAFTELANKLGNDYIGNLPTCGFVHIELEATQWQGIRDGITKTVVLPRQLKNKKKVV